MIDYRFPGSFVFFVAIFNGTKNLKKTHLYIIIIIIIYNPPTFMENTVTTADTL
jgi:hypothetical protein